MLVHIYTGDNPALSEFEDEAILDLLKLADMYLLKTPKLLAGRQSLTVLMLPILSQASSQSTGSSPPLRVSSE